MGFEGPFLCALTTILGFEGGVYKHPTYFAYAAKNR